MIDPLTYVPLYIRIKYQDTQLGSATGFTVSYNGKRYLITNWHVVSGRNSQTEGCLDDYLSLPTHLTVSFHSNFEDSDGIYQWIMRDIELYDDNGEKLWKELSPRNGVDVIAIPLEDLTHLGRVKYYDLPLTEWEKGYAAMVPAEPVSIIGYPFGLKSAGEFPIWITGSIASDVVLDIPITKMKLAHSKEAIYTGAVPIFLVDALTQCGMSGAPVIARKFKTPTIIDESNPDRTKHSDFFLGIYSGRLTKEEKSNLGMVWKPTILKRLLDEELRI